MALRGSAWVGVVVVRLAGNGTQRASALPMQSSVKMSRTAAEWHRVFRHPGHRTLSTECQDTFAENIARGVSGKDCVHCNRYDKLATNAWYYLGVGGGGVVGGQEYSESQCMLKALAFDDTNSDAWRNL